MTSWSVEEWQSAHASAAWIGMRFVPAWQPEPEHPAGTVAGSWSSRWSGIVWHASHEVSFVAIAFTTFGSALSWQTEHW